jgi:hypothetical protein
LNSNNQAEQETKMTTVENKGQAKELTIKEWLAIRTAAGLKIDPGTAEVDWEYAQVADPYGVFPERAKEQDCVGRAYFARSPDSDVWVVFGDLPEATRKALWEKHKGRLAFPAGLPFIAPNYSDRDD